MGKDRRQFQLEPLEQRLLLSGNGILDGLVAAAPPTEPLVSIQGYEVDEQITIADQSNSNYYPEAQLSNLFQEAEQGAEPEADASDLEREDPFTDTLSEADNPIEDIAP